MLLENNDKIILKQYIDSFITGKNFTSDSKVVIKNLVYLLFLNYPRLVVPSLDICTNLPGRAEIKVLWISAILDFVKTDHPNIPDNDELVKKLESLTNNSQTNVRLNALISIWLITENNEFLEKGLDDKASKIRQQCNSILTNPESKRKNIQSA